MIGVEGAWNRKASGRGVHVRISCMLRLLDSCFDVRLCLLVFLTPDPACMHDSPDDGVDADHTEFQGNFDRENSCEFFAPWDIETDVHGTAVASIVAGNANDQCAVGIAPEATICSCVGPDGLDDAPELLVQNPETGNRYEILRQVKFPRTRLIMSFCQSLRRRWCQLIFRPTHGGQMYARRMAWVGRGVYSSACSRRNIRIPRVGYAGTSATWTTCPTNARLLLVRTARKTTKRMSWHVSYEPTTQTWCSTHVWGFIFVRFFRFGVSGFVCWM
jgi:Subtilase family